MGFWRAFYYYMGWPYYDNWEEKQRDLKYILHKQIINTDMTKLLKPYEPEEEFLEKSINYSKGHYLHNNKNTDLIAEQVPKRPACEQLFFKNKKVITELKNKISNNNINKNEKSNNGNINTVNGRNRKRTNQRKRKKTNSY